MHDLPMWVPVLFGTFIFFVVCVGCLMFYTLFVGRGKRR